MGSVPSEPIQLLANPHACHWDIHGLGTSAQVIYQALTVSLTRKNYDSVSIRHPLVHLLLNEPSPVPALDYPHCV
jgi:hypothetical protein